MIIVCITQCIAEHPTLLTESEVPHQTVYCGLSIQPSATPDTRGPPGCSVPQANRAAGVYRVGMVVQQRL